MSKLSNILIVASYAMVAFVAGAISRQAWGMSLELAWLFSAAVFLTCAQLHSMISRAQERVTYEKEIAALHRTQRIVSEELERTTRQMKEMADVSEAKASARNNQLVSEVRLLETLVRQMTSDVEKKAREQLKAALALDGKKEPEVKPKSVRYASDLKQVFDQLSESELVDLIQGCLDENRVDVYLQPIVSLPQRKVRYYESLTRLRTENDEVIEPSTYMHIAEQTGRISMIDNLLLFRCVQIVRKLIQRGEDLAIFCNISHHTLNDHDFFPQFLDFMKSNRDLTKHLIFEFGQETVDHTGPMEKSNLRRLSDLGFRFSMDKVKGLDLNLAELRDRHFTYIKIEPEILLSALPDEDRMDWAEPANLLEEEGPVEAIEVDDVEVIEGDLNPIDEYDLGVDAFTGGTWDEEPKDERGPLNPGHMGIHAADFKELLNRFGMDLIVEKIETEHEVIEMVELDVDYGQGYLFGQPRPVRNSDMDERIASWEELEDQQVAGVLDDESNVA